MNEMKHESFVKEIVAILQRNKIIKENEAHALVKSFQDSSKPYFDDFLLEEGLVEKGDLLKALAEYYQVPFFDVTGYLFDHELVRVFPEDVLVRNVLIPFEKDDDNLLIMVTSDPNNPDLLSDIGQHVSYDIQFRVGIRQDILDAIEEFYEKSLTDEDSDDEELDEMREVREKQVRQDRDIEEIADEEIDRHE